MPSKKSNRRAPMTRRATLINGAILSAGALGVGVGSVLGRSDEPVRSAKETIYRLKDFRVDSSIEPKFVIVHGADVERMTRAGIDRLGGISRFIDPGDRVLIKPNVAWDRTKEQAANTDPDLVASVARLAIEAKAASVVVTDVSLSDPVRAFTRSGIKDATERVGAKLWIPSKSDFELTDMGGELLGIWPVAKIYHQVDKLINVPIVKHHSLSAATVAMKNWYGVLGGRRNRLHQNIDLSIADLASAVRPTLTVLSAIRALVRNGPTGGSLDDVIIKNEIVVGLDEVAIDAYAMEMIGVDPHSVPYMSMAADRRLGLIDWRSLAHDEITV